MKSDRENSIFLILEIKSFWHETCVDVCNFILHPLSNKNSITHKKRIKIYVTMVNTYTNCYLDDLPENVMESQC